MSSTTTLNGQIIFSSTSFAWFVVEVFSVTPAVCPGCRTDGRKEFKLEGERNDAGFRAAGQTSNSSVAAEKVAISKEPWVCADFPVQDSGLIASKRKCSKRLVFTRFARVIPIPPAAVATLINHYNRESKSCTSIGSNFARYEQLIFAQ